MRRRPPRRTLQTSTALSPLPPSTPTLPLVPSIQPGEPRYHPDRTVIDRPSFHPHLSPCRTSRPHKSVLRNARSDVGRCSSSPSPRPSKRSLSISARRQIPISSLPSAIPSSTPTFTETAHRSHPPSQQLRRTWNLVRPSRIPTLSLLPQPSLPTRQLADSHQSLVPARSTQDPLPFIRLSST